jgi:hypothetical protein
LRSWRLGGLICGHENWIGLFGRGQDFLHTDKTGPHNRPQFPFLRFSCGRKEGHGQLLKRHEIHAMTRKEIVLVIFTVILAGVYFCCFTDGLKKKHMGIEHAVRPNVAVPGLRGNPGNPAEPSAYTITFSLGSEYKLTSVKVVPAAESQMNPNVHPLWHLVGDAKSDPTRFIVYGMPIPGMKPSVTGANADPLAYDVEYRLLVEAGRIKGEHSFKITGPGGSQR